MLFALKFIRFEPVTFRDFIYKTWKRFVCGETLEAICIVTMADPLNFHSDMTQNNSNF